MSIVKKNLRITLSILMAVLFVFNSMVSVYADSSFTISPTKEVESSTGYYRDTVNGGDVKTYIFFIKNQKKTPIQLKVYPADAVPTENGGRSFSAKEDKLINVGTWLSPTGVINLDLKANETKQITYKVQVPKEIVPGQYVGVVAAEELSQDNKSNTDSKNATLAIDIVNRAGIQVVLENRIEQSTHSMSIDDFKHDYISSGFSRLTIKLSNTGTILEKPTGKIIVKKSDGEEVFVRDYQADSIYANTTADMVYHIQDKILPPADYSVYYEATFSGKTISKTFNFNVTKEEAVNSQESLEYSGQLIKGKTFWDWLNDHTWVIIIFFILIVFILAALILFILLFFRRKKKKDEDKIQEVKSSDS